MWSDIARVTLKKFMSDWLLTFLTFEKYKGFKIEIMLFILKIFVTDKSFHAFSWAECCEVMGYTGVWYYCCLVQNCNLKVNPHLATETICFPLSCPAQNSRQNVPIPCVSVMFNSPASYVPGIYRTFFSMNLHSVGNGYVATKTVHFPGSLAVWEVRGRELRRLGVWRKVARSHLVGVILMSTWVTWRTPIRLLPESWVPNKVVLESSEGPVKMPFAAC